jgi:hypothetical protein
MSEGMETLGLCTGTLSAFAVDSSPSIEGIHQHGAVAVRLAILNGAIVDAEEASAGPGGESVSFSVSGTVRSLVSHSPVSRHFPM